LRAPAARKVPDFALGSAEEAAPAVVVPAKGKTPAKKKDEKQNKK
jgi:hypothetical protein